MPRSIRRVALCAGVTLTTALAGCSSSGNSGNQSTNAPTTPPTTSSGPADTSSPVTSPTPPQSSGGGGGPADAATKKAISQAFKVFFDTKTPLGASIAVLQHGAKFRQALIKESNSPSAQNISAKVTAVQMQSANVGVVTFTLSSGGSPLLPNTHGYAVQEDGRWKVAAQTFCAMLQLEGTAPAVCSDKAITALPN